MHTLLTNFYTLLCDSPFPFFCVIRDDIGQPRAWLPPHLQQMALTIKSDGGIHLAGLSNQGHPPLQHWPICILCTADEAPCPHRSRHLGTGCGNQSQPFLAGACRNPPKLLYVLNITCVCRGKCRGKGNYLKDAPSHIQRYDEVLSIILSLSQKQMWHRWDLSWNRHAVQPSGVPRSSPSSQSFPVLLPSLLPYNCLSLFILLLKIKVQKAPK